MTLLDVLVVVIVLVAAAAGFRSLDGTARAGRLLGVVVGAGAGAPLGQWAAGFAAGGASRTGFLLLGLALGLVVGAAVGGWIGGLLSRVLQKGHLGVVDRAVGALAGAGGALLALWLLSWVPAAVLGGPALEPLAAVLEPLGGHSEILSGLPSALPRTDGTFRDAVEPLARDAVEPPAR